MKTQTATRVGTLTKTALVTLALSGIAAAGILTANKTAKNPTPTPATEVKKEESQKATPTEVTYKSCLDSDFGAYGIGGKLTAITTDGKKIEKQDSCKTSGTLTEWYCDGKTPKKITRDIPKSFGVWCTICEDGGVVSTYPDRYVSCPGSGTAWKKYDKCLDSDGGSDGTKYFTTKGKVTVSFGTEKYTKEDRCLNNSTLEEWGCNPKTKTLTRTKLIDCSTLLGLGMIPSQCKDGRCCSTNPKAPAALKCK
jgi:hypothetical protein